MRSSTVWRMAILTACAITILGVVSAQGQVDAVISAGTSTPIVAPLARSAPIRLSSRYVRKATGNNQKYALWEGFLNNASRPPSEERTLTGFVLRNTGTAPVTVHLGTAVAPDIRDSNSDGRRHVDSSLFSITVAPGVTQIETLPEVRLDQPLDVEVFGTAELTIFYRDLP